MTKGRKILLVIGGLFLVLIVAAGGFFAWKRHVVKTAEERALAFVNEALAAGRGSEALGVIQGRNRTTTRQTEEQRALWQSLEIKALTQMGSSSRLLALYDSNPAPFDKEEEASVQVGRALSQAQKFEPLDKLREKWKGKETKAASWFEMDVDSLLMRGKRDDAMAMLNSRKFTGPEDSGRLARLALLNTPKDMKAAWGYLEEAAKVNPTNSEVRLFRAQLLEGNNQPAAAAFEYQAALAANTNSPYLRDHLGQFYNRNGSHDLAVLTWANGLTNSQTSDMLWLRVAFWTKLTRTIKFDFTANKPPFGPVQPFVQYLLDLPPGTFWDDAQFQKTAEARRFEQQFQETFWLRLLDYLKQGNETEAAKLVEFNRFRERSYQVDLESAILRVLAYRKSGKFVLPVGVNIPLSDMPPKTRHQFLEQIDAFTKDSKLPVPADLERLLKGKNAFCAVFLAFGWAEAALNLPHDEIIPSDLPEWLAYGLTQATRFNRGYDEGLKFAGDQKPAPALELLKGELLVGSKNYDEAIKKFSALASANNDVAPHASARLSETHLFLKQYDQARVAVESAPRLRDTIAGKQLLAHVALAQGKNDEAIKIYNTIEGESDEAKSFLARQAFLDKNWARARRLTEELLKKYPDNLQFHQNLKDIANAEAAK